MINLNEINNDYIIPITDEIQNPIEYAKLTNSIYGMYRQNTIYHFGNPFNSHQEYIDWLLGDNTSHKARQNWVLHLLKMGTLKNKKILTNPNEYDMRNASILYWIINFYY